jgi:hypothetical protein
VGGWLIAVVPPLMLGLPLAVFRFGKSEHAKRTAVFLLALPLLQAVFGSLYGAFEDYRAKRFVEGDSTFTKPASLLRSAISMPGIGAATRCSGSA